MDSHKVARYRSIMNAPPPQDKFRAYRARKKALGLREIRLWIPETRTPAFKAEARRQAALLDHSDDEREASDMMERFAEEAWRDWK